MAGGISVTASRMYRNRYDRVGRSLKIGFMHGSQIEEHGSKMADDVRVLFSNRR
jgi:hypothetical protein